MIFVFKCRKGHNLEVAEENAEETNGSACTICYSTLLLIGVRR